MHSKCTTYLVEHENDSTQNACIMTILYGLRAKFTVRELEPSVMMRACADAYCCGYFLVCNDHQFELLYTGTVLFYLMQSCYMHCN